MSRDFALRFKMPKQLERCEIFPQDARNRLDAAERACEVHKARATIRAIMVNRIHESARGR